MSDPIRFGVLSTANIARAAVAPAIRAADGARLAAVGSRDESRALAFADRIGAPRAHGTYEALLDDPEVDAIYLALPNALHESWTIRALEAGKHVLCEKPLAPTAAACARMGDAAERADRVLAEAFMYRHHPRLLAAAEAVRSGRIGRPTFVTTTFTFAVTDPANIRLSRELAGGALLDVGCYTVDVVLRLLGEDPDAVTAYARFDGDDPRAGVDLETSASLRFPSGATASATSALTLPRRESVEVRGTEGTLRFEKSFLPGPDATETTFVAPDGVETLERHPGEDPYRAMVEAFVRRVRGEPRATDPVADARTAARTVRVLEAAAASARGGGAVFALD